MPLPTGPSNGSQASKPAGLPSRPIRPPVAPIEPSEEVPAAPSIQMSTDDLLALATSSDEYVDENDAFAEINDEPDFEVLSEEKPTQSRKEREATHRFEQSQRKSAPRKKPKNNVLSPQSGEIDEKGQNVFIDKKEKKVKPFGGKKSLKVSDLDRRKNLRKNARIVQVFVIGLVLVTLGFAVKNAFFPAPSLSASDVQNIVYNTTNTTAFPIEKGQSFAENFMSAYFSYNASNPDSSAVMQYYSTGTLAAGGAAPGLTPKPGVTQTVVYGPIVYQSQSVSDSSALYTVGALVDIESSTAGAAQSTAAAANATASAATANLSANSGSVSTATGGKLMWQYYAVNVYYDKSTDSFAIVSYPSIVPNPSILSSKDVPDAAAIGTGDAIDSSVLSAATPTIYGFMEAFRVSSSQNSSKLLPFLETNPPATLLKGLDGAYDFKGGEADTNSIAMSGYTTLTSDIKIALTVTWEQTTAGISTESLSQYVMTLTPEAGGYKVVKFVPLSYVPQDKSTTN